jgi:TonB family protein
VDTIRKRISDEWIQGRIDSSVRSAPRVYVAFDIERDGEITNPRIEESSNNDQVDRSALRAVAATRRLSPLPREFRGARVSVRFWFELRR